MFRRNYIRKDSFTDAKWAHHVDACPGVEMCPIGHWCSAVADVRDEYIDARVDPMVIREAIVRAALGDDSMRWILEFIKDCCDTADLFMDAASEDYKALNDKASWPPFPGCD